MPSKSEIQNEISLLNKHRYYQLDQKSYDFDNAEIRVQFMV